MLHKTYDNALPLQSGIISEHFIIRTRIWLFLLLPFLITTSCKSDSAKPAKGETAGSGFTEVETFVALPTEIDNIITTHGNILPAEEVELRSEIAGQVTGIFFKEGNQVSAGQLLVQIDDSELLPALEKLKIQLKVASDELDRKKALFEIQGISKEEYEAAELKVASLRADLQLTKAQLEKSRITAPFSGRIGLRQVSPGAYVTVGQIIARLVQTDPVKIEFTVPEQYADEIKNGTLVEFSLTGSDKKYQARVFATEPSLDRETRSLRVRALADNKDAHLLPGSFAELTITLEKIPDALMVPALAVTQDIQGFKVFIMRNGTATTSIVKTGIQRGDFVQIISGIHPGDTVITTSLLSLREGVPVKPKPAKPLLKNTQ